MYQVLKRFTVLMVCAALLITIFAGCAGEKQNPDGKQATQGNASTLDQKEPESVTLEHFKLWWVVPTISQLPLVESAVVQEIMKKFNVEFDLTEIQAGQFAEKKNLWISSQEIPDMMMWVTKDEANKFGPQGAFYELSGVLESKLPNLKKLLDSAPAGKYNAYTTEGKMYRCPEYMENGIPIFDLSYIKAEFDSVGATKFDTWEDIYVALKAIKAKYPDSYPFLSRGKEITAAALRNFVLIGFTENKGVALPAFDYDSNTFVNPYTVSGFKEGIEFIRKLYAEKLLDPEFISTDMTLLKSKFQNKKGFMTCDFLGGLASFDEMQTLVNNGIHPLPIPGVEGKRRVFASKPIHIADMGTTVNGTLEGAKLDRVLDILNYLYSDECYNLLYWNPDVTVEKDGQKMYSDLLYSRDPETLNKYLPWALNEGFRINWETITKPGTPFADMKFNVYLNPSNEDKYSPAAPTLPFSEEEVTRIAELKSAIGEYYESNVDQFILGKKSMDEWDAFTAETNSKGVDELAKIYNDAYMKYIK